MLLTQQNLQDIQKNLHRLQGVSVGLSPFYARVSYYMDSQLNEIWRILQEGETPFEQLDGHSKKGFEAVDQEALLMEETKEPFNPDVKKKLRRKILDRKVVETLHETQR